METVAATERVTTLMTPTEKSTLEAKAKQAGVSVGEFVRRSVECYDPDGAADIAQLTALADQLRQSNREASDALDRALASIQETRTQLAGRGAA
ncbi:MAG TPA: hypothetical protein HPQ04_14970 [Rhodospirillaceae bacterium]|nr:hypothetical protein [Rhodospirillaceae bacterium]